MIDSVRVYKCDNLTHIFGLIFPLLVVRECKGKLVVAGALLMFIFHMMTIAAQGR